MRRIVTVPDLHGKDTWKKLEVDSFDKLVFLGDYIDSKGKIGLQEELANLQAIIELKKRWPDKVVLLLGNHDIQYLYFPKYLSSSINYDGQPDFTSLFVQNSVLFQAAYQVENHVWTHAGLSKAWLRHYYPIMKPFIEHDILSELAHVLNKMQAQHMEILATCSMIRGGMSAYGGIFWADMSETHDDHLQGIHQYVGHTKVAEILKVGDRNGSIHFLDCLNTKEDFFVLTLD